MDLTPYVPFMIPATVLALSVAARVASDIATQAAARQDSRVARIERAVQRIAGGVASDLQRLGPVTTAPSVLNAIKSAAVAEGAAYYASAAPDLLKAAGASKESLIAMINGTVGNKMLAAAAAALVPADAPAAALASPAPDPSQAAQAAPAGPAASVAAPPPPGVSV